MSQETHRFQIGRFVCSVISDGTNNYHHPAQVLFANAPREELADALRQFDIDLDTWDVYVSPYPSIVIETGQHRVLVDTGAGSLTPSTGRLLSNLRAMGLAPQDIDTVFLTHAHPDHIGGNVDGAGKPIYPNARYVMWQREWDFWTGEPDMSSMSAPDEMKQALISYAQNNLPLIQDRIDLIAAEQEIVPGLRALAAPGHTPGHMALLVESKGEQLLCSADTVLHPAHLHHPDWYAAVDTDPAQVVATRRHLLNWAAGENVLIHAYHFEWPGLGHLAPSGSGWQWRPLAENGAAE